MSIERPERTNRQNEIAAAKSSGEFGPRFGQVVTGQTSIDTPERRIYLNKKAIAGPGGFIDFNRRYGIPGENRTFVTEVEKLQRENPADHIVTVSIRELNPEKVVTQATENDLPYNPGGQFRVDYHLLDNGAGIVKHVRAYREEGWDHLENRLGEGIREVGDNDRETLGTLLTELETGTIFQQEGVRVTDSVTVHLRVTGEPTPEGCIPLEVDPPQQ